MSLVLGAPEPLSANHRLDTFDCGEPGLNEWLKRRAFANHSSGASRCFVVATPEHEVLGYYALATGAVAHTIATGQVRRNMPDPVPVMVLGRLAVDHRAQGIQLGGALLQDALERTTAIAEHAGVRALLVHSLNGPAKRFYQHYGFQESPLHPMTLMLRITPAT